MSGCCKVRSVSPTTRRSADVLIKAAREKDTRRCFAAAGRDSRHAGIGRPPAGGVAAGVGSRREPSSVSAVRKGGESDDRRHSFDWSDFYLICFAVGFCFSFFSFVFGGSRFGRLHLPHFHGHSVPHAAGAPAAMLRSPAVSARGACGDRTSAQSAHASRRAGAVFRRSIRLRWPRSWPGLAAQDIC